MTSGSTTTTAAERSMFRTDDDSALSPDHTLRRRPAQTWRSPELETAMRKPLSEWPAPKTGHRPPIRPRSTPADDDELLPGVT
jgi:hypothetical protein